jgi:putative transcriptional regulator
MDYLKLYRNASKDYPPISAKEIKAIRRAYNLSQPSFAKLLKISVKTLQNYEISRTRASSSATALFRFAKENPDLFLKKLTEDARPFMK